MSAYSDWKCGAIDDQEYSDYCAWEARMDEALYEKELNSDYDDEDDEDYE